MHKIISPDKNYYFMYNKNELTLYTTKNRKIAKFKLNVDKFSFKWIILNSQIYLFAPLYINIKNNYDSDNYLCLIRMSDGVLMGRGPKNNYYIDTRIIYDDRNKYLVTRGNKHLLWKIGGFLKMNRWGFLVKDDLNDIPIINHYLKKDIYEYMDVVFTEPPKHKDSRHSFPYNYMDLHGNNRLDMLNCFKEMSCSFSMPSDIKRFYHTGSKYY